MIKLIDPSERVPPTGKQVFALDVEGNLDIVRYETERYCVLGSPQGSYGKGFVSELAGGLPVEIVQWVDLNATPQPFDIAVLNALEGLPYSVLFNAIGGALIRNALDSALKDPQ